MTIDQMIEVLRLRLEGINSRADASSLLAEEPGPGRRCCFFLGMLEMARNQQIEIEQAHTFAPIFITRKPSNSSTDHSGQ
jgi:chromatin segregation and condensation protein Rec8/ScpA/Scc1 (kleisin family)